MKVDEKNGGRLIVFFCASGPIRRNESRFLESERRGVKVVLTDTAINCNVVVKTHARVRPVVWFFTRWVPMRTPWIRRCEHRGGHTSVRTPFFTVDIVHMAPSLFVRGRSVPGEDECRNLYCGSNINHHHLAVLVCPDRMIPLTSVSSHWQCVSEFWRRA